MPIGEKTKLLWQNPEYRKHMSEVHKGLKHSDKIKRKIGLFHKGKYVSPETKKKMSDSRIGKIPWNKGKKCPQLAGENNSFWKGGIIKSHKYILIHKPQHPFCDNKGYIREHRLVIEKQIGRYLLPEEHVHHLNEIKDDNRPENLMSFISNSAHRRFHHNPNNVKSSEIIFDGRLKR